jgi:hypothetical protein
MKVVRKAKKTEENCVVSGVEWNVSRSVDGRKPKLQSYGKISALTDVVCVTHDWPWGFP